MLFRLQFILVIDELSTAVAWPLQYRDGIMCLTHDPLESVGYGSEELALEDSTRWIERFPQIGSFEITDFVGGSK